MAANVNMRNFERVPGRWQGRRIKFYRNGDARFKGKPLVVNLYHFRTIDALCEELTAKLTPDFGQVRQIFTPQGGTSLRDVQNLLHPAVEAGTRGLVAGGKGPFIKVGGGYGDLDYRNRRTGDIDLSRPFSADEIDEIRREAVRTSMSRKSSRHDLLLPPQTARRTSSESNIDDVAIQVYRNGFAEEPLRTVIMKRGKYQATLGRLYRLDGTPVVKGRDIQENGIYVVAEKGEKFLPRNYQASRIPGQDDTGYSSRWASRAPSRMQSEYLRLPTGAKTPRSVSESGADEEVTLQVYRNGFPDQPLKTVTTKRSKFQSNLGRLYRLDGTPVVRGKEIQDNGVYVVAERGEQFLKRNYVGGSIHIVPNAKGRDRLKDNPALKRRKSRRDLNEDPKPGRSDKPKNPGNNAYGKPQPQQELNGTFTGQEDPYYDNDAGNYGYSNDDSQQPKSILKQRTKATILEAENSKMRSRRSQQQQDYDEDEDDEYEEKRQRQSRKTRDLDEEEGYYESPRPAENQKQQAREQQIPRGQQNLSPKDEYKYQDRRREIDSAYQSDAGGDDFRLKTNSAGPYNAKYRAGKRIFDEDYDDKSIFKARTPNTITAGAETVKDSRKATMDMPIDYYKAEIVQEELAV